MYRTIISYRDQLVKEKALLEAEVRRAPKGDFLAVKNGNSSKWFVTLNDKREYIPKERRKYAASLAKKKYAKDRLDIVNKELRALQYYEKHHADSVDVMQKYLAKNSAYRELLIDKYYRIEDELREWMNADYEKSSKHLENLIKESDSSMDHRSKSEALIEMALTAAGIPYRYECALEIRGLKVYPDFTIRRPSDGKRIYWEHLGMMDDDSYIDSFGRKLTLYSSADIFLGENLFITVETKNSPLSISDVNHIIERISKG